MRIDAYVEVDSDKAKLVSELADDSDEIDEAELLSKLSAYARDKSELSEEARDNKGIPTLSIPVKGTLDFEGEKPLNALLTRLESEYLNLIDQAFSKGERSTGCSLDG